MSLPNGTKLAHYEIVEPIGKGGMGEVYRAKDSRLGRDVAIKVLPAEFSHERERLDRFEREARLLAQLNHTNIAMLHGLEEHEGQQFLVMELIEGETLAERIAKGPIPVNEAIPLFVQIAEGLSAAHDKGIIHRDLKPANIKIGPHGDVKILDFGLAKAFSSEEDASADSSHSPTLTKGTALGAILGTAPYMSPEQARGKRIDKRTDVWSFGCCLFEAVTGRAAFREETVSDTIAKVLGSEPDWEALPERTPPLLRRLLERNLRKDSRQRFHDIADTRIELEELLAGPPVYNLAVRRRRSIVFPIVAALVVGVAGTVAVQRLMDREASRQGRIVQITSVDGAEDHPTWSPDGGRLAYESTQHGNTDIFVAQLGGGEPLNLTGDHLGEDRYPSWSPDGSRVALLSMRNGLWGLHVVSALGGSPRRLAPVQRPTGPPQWSADGNQIAIADWNTAGNFVSLVSLQTQETRRIAFPEHEKSRVYHLSWSPDGQYFAYIEANATADELSQLWILAAAGGAPSSVTNGATNVWSPSWSPDARRLFYVSNRGGPMDLWEQDLDALSRPEGQPHRITSGLGMRTAVFSPDNTKLAYSRGPWLGPNTVWRVPIFQDRTSTWVDAEQLTFDNAFTQYIDLSPDGDRLLLSSDRSGNQDLWVLPSGGGEMTQLTTEPTPDWAPRWSPDGTQIVFYSFRSGNRDIWVMPSDGGPARQITLDPSGDFNPSWSPDGQEISFVSSRESRARNIWIVSAKGGEPRRVTTDGANEHAWSPDGRWLVAAHSGRGIYRVPVEGGDTEFLTEHGTYPRLSPDGNVLYYTDPDGPIWEMSLDDRQPRALTDFVGRRGKIGWTLDTDGQYLYFTWLDDLADIWVMDVVEN